MATRNSQIAKIIEKRQPLAKGIDIVIGNLRILSRELSKIDNERVEIIKHVNSINAGRLNDVQFEPLRLKIESQIVILEKLRRRFSRPTLSIGVVGMARQGKSRLLQTISGLSSNEIPDGDRQDCTGVRSNIEHNPVVTPYAEVNFHTENSFLNEIIIPYYRELSLSPRPQDLDDFEKGQIPPLEKAKILSNPNEKKHLTLAEAQYERLQLYRNQLGNYRVMLRQKTLHIDLISEPNKLREYVAQDTTSGKRTYSYMAVKEVRIVCNFPHDDVGKITLIDMPGLGDTGVGDQDRLIRTLGEDVDFVSFVRMPSSKGDRWSDSDLILYDLVRTAIDSLPINRWSFMTLNRTTSTAKQGDNQNNCDDLEKTIEEKRILVQHCVTVDCSNASVVGSQLVDPILDYLVANIEQLDKQYAKTCQDALSEIQKEIEAELQKAKGALGKEKAITEDFPLFDELFSDKKNGLWTVLSNRLVIVLNQFKAQRNEPNEICRKYIIDALGKCHTPENRLLPTLEDIEKQAVAQLSFEAAYAYYLHDMRHQITREFATLDKALFDVMENIKIQIANTFKQFGRFDKLPDLNKLNGAEFLNTSTTMISELGLDPKFKHLQNAFQELAEFQLQYKGFLYHRVREQLNEVDPDTTSRKLLTATAENIQENLKSARGKTLYQLEIAFKSWLTDPNVVAFAILEQFIDQVIRNDASRSGWQQIYHHLRDEVWPDKFKSFHEESRLRIKWQTAIENANTLSQIHKFQYL